MSSSYTDNNPLPEQKPAEETQRPTCTARLSIGYIGLAVIVVIAIVVWVSLSG